MSSASTAGRWPVILSGRAIRELRHLGKDQKTLDVVRKKFHELSHGQFSTDNHLAIRGTSEHVPIYRARTSIDLRIIYQIDLATDPTAHFDQQVIKVFTVSSRARISYEFWVKVAKHLVKLGPEYRSRCLVRTTVKDHGLPTCIPEQFTHEKYNSLVVDNNYSFEGGSDLAELHETLVWVLILSYYPSKAVSTDEMIAWRNLLQLPSLYILADMEAVLPMALNPDERRIVRHQGTSVVVGRSGTGKTTALIYKLRATAQAATCSSEIPIRQLFVTRSPVLTKHIANNYQGLVESSEIAHRTREELYELRKRKEREEERELVEYDAEVDLRKDLPDRFSLLKDSNFPLFVSFEKLCELLEADVTALRGENPPILSPIITFTDFKYRYWPRFNRALTRKLDPGLVFSEILGVIKGRGSNLSKEDYISGLSHKKSPLLFDVRDRVYAIFEAYSNQASNWKQRDTADRTRTILNAHSHNPLPKLSLVDYIFVDEVQDQLMLDVHLLHSLCSNPDGGYWCGDTAQTISVGSSFRIKDLKEFLYMDRSAHIKSNIYYDLPANFETFELSVNFRSHSGIVRYAASLVELIYTMFPNSIDRMAPETARIPGPAPLLFISPIADEDVFVRHLLGAKLSIGNTFGAHQAIIVRSQTTASSLTDRLRKRCNVITLLETKGLEFDDIIIYNFFHESEASMSCWKAMLALTGELKDGRICYDKSTVLPTTLPTLCSELKQLYVAVTRARHRCWLWDSGGVIDLAKDFWTIFDLITISESLERVGAFAVSSKDLREWARRGRDFFSSGLYANARLCFERAEQSKEAAIADAYQHMSEAKQTLRKADYCKAGKLMEDCASRKDINDLNNVLWHHAAACFLSAGDIPGASRSYRGSKLYDRAVSVSFEHQNFDDVLLTLLPYSELIDQDTFTRVRDVARMYYLRTSNYSKLRELFSNSQNACIEYARLYGFTTQLKELLRESFHFEDLANVHIEEGSPAEASCCLLQISRAPSTISRIVKMAIGYFWTNLSLDSQPDRTVCEQALRLLKILSTLETALDDSTSFDFDLFKKYLEKNTPSIDVLDNLDLRPTELEPRMIIAYHLVLHSEDTWIHDVKNMFRRLKAWLMYARNIKSIAELVNPSRVRRVQQILGVSLPKKKAHNDKFVHVSSGSLIYVSAKHQHFGIDTTSSRGENLIAVADADKIIKSEMLKRLEARLMDLHLELIQSPLVACPLNEENSAEILGTAANGLVFEDQIRVVFMAAVALRLVNTSILKNPLDGTKTTVRHAWVMRLFDLINLPTGAIHDLSALPQPTIEHSPEKYFQDWVSEYIMQSIEPEGAYPRLFLSGFFMAESLAFELERHYGSGLLADRIYPAGHQSLLADISCLFLRKNGPRVARSISVLQRLVDVGASIDVSLLVHCIERITREAILAERTAASSQLLSGIGGLIMPSSWIRSLLSYVDLGESTFDIGPLCDLVSCIDKVIRRIQDKIPGHWQVLGAKSWKHSISSLSVRMYWCIALIIVNIDPKHQALQVALRTLQQNAIDLESRFKCEALHHEDELDTKIESIIMSHDQESCLSALCHTLRHEELVLLIRDSDACCPAKRRPMSRIIEFRDLLDLRQQMFGHLTNAQCPFGSRMEVEVDSAPPAAVSVDSTPPHTEKTITAPALTTIKDQENQAARRIQLWFRRQVQMSASFLGKEVQYYRRFSSLISQHIAGKSKRARLFRVVFRGPVLLVLLSLEILAEQLEECLEATSDDLKALSISTETMEKLQARHKTLSGYYKATEKIRKEMSPDSPPGVFKMNNLAAVKTRLNQYIKTSLVNILEFDYLQGMETIDEAKELFWCGVNVIRKA